MTKVVLVLVAVAVIESVMVLWYVDCHCHGRAWIWSSEFTCTSDDVRMLLYADLSLFPPFLQLLQMTTHELPGCSTSDMHREIGDVN